ncbi:MAG: hypothetical protein JW973_17340 [Bacteroidales bacterium]|nr:hypothetical protein [Bacteroidales bacterium]
MTLFLYTATQLHRRIICSIPVFLFIFLSSELSGLDSFHQLQSLKFQKISNPGSLTNNWINNIIKDADGYLWFATENGVARYDGTNVSNYYYDQKDAGSIYGNFIVSFLLDKNNQLWIGTDLGLVVYNKTCDNFQRIVTDVPYESRYYISDLELLPDNTVIAITNNRVLYYDRESGYLKHFISMYDIPELDNTDAFSQCFIDPVSGHLWISSIKKFIIAEYPSRKISYLDHPCGLVRNTTLSGKSTLWISCQNGLFSLDLKTREISRFLPEEKEYRNFFEKEIREFIQDSDGNYWVATDKEGIIYYQKKTARCIRYYHKEFDDQSLNGNLIRKIFIDDCGILWVGMQYAGINYAVLSNPKEFFTYQVIPEQANTISSNVVTSILEDRDNNLWLGTDGNGLNIIEQATGKVKVLYADERKSNGISTNSILALYQDSNGNIWAGGYMGAICCYNPLTRKWKQYPVICSQPGCDGLHDVRMFMEDSKHRLWIATNGHGLFMFDYRNEKFRFHSTIDGKIIDDHVLSLCEDSAGKLWVGTYNGACLLDPENYTSLFFDYSEFSPTGLSNNWIYCIHRDRKDRIWLGTSYGLNQYNYDRRTFTRYYASDGLAGNVIDGILEDDEGNLWITTNNGISKFNPDSMKFLNLYREDGLPGNEFIHGSYYKSRSGEMFFGSNDGLVSFHPSHIRPDRNIPPIVILDVLVFFRSISKDYLCNADLQETGRKTIRLSYRQSTVTFNYTALNYLNPRNNKFSYILEGYERNWNDVGNRREATYTNLRPGHYVFRVKGCNNDGICNDTGDSIELIISPPWWGTWLFRIFLGVTLFLSLLGLYYWRLNTIVRQKAKLEFLVNKRTAELHKKNDELDEMNKMNDRILSIIAHDLKSPFNTIMGFTELLVKKGDKVDDNYRYKYIGYMQASLKKILVLMENLLLWSSSQLKGTAINPVLFSLTEQISKNIELINDSAIQKSITVNLATQKDYRVKADVNMIDAVIRNLLSNAVKFSNHNDIITVDVKAVDSEIICTVTDHGMGMDEKELQLLFSFDSRKLKAGTDREQGSGLGLVICHDFIIRNGGRIWVESKQGEGSTFSFAIPSGEGPGASG